MRKISYFLVLLLITTQASATYIVVLKNGTRYRARDKWTLQGGKAIVQLEDGRTLQLDPNLIDNARSEEATRLGYGGAKVISTPGANQGQSTTPRSSLGETTRLRTGVTPGQQQPAQQKAGSTVSAQSPYSGTGALGHDVMVKFNNAYENTGFYDAKVFPSAPYSLRVQLTADNEDQVFKAISATAYVMTRVPGLTKARLDQVELFMATSAGGAAGRFLMAQEDAQAIDTKRSTIPSYYVRKVIY